MRRIKLMLIALIVLGSVGGVLALNVTRDVGRCTTATVDGLCPASAICPNGYLGAINNQPATPTRCYTITANTARCSVDMPACSATAKIGPD